MSTIREDISQVKRLVNSVHQDVRISNRFVYNKLLDMTSLIIKRDADSRKIYKNIELFTTIECVELEETELKNCTNIFIPNCSYVMRSVNKIPKAFLSGNGSIINVYSIDRSVQFIQTTPLVYSKVQKREFKGNEKYFWILDDYLYIPGNIAAVTIDVLSIDKRTKKCQPLLDSPSFIPDYLASDVIRVVATEIGSIMKRIPTDENPNLNSNEAR